jgi:hypothetical protein
MLWRFGKKGVAVMYMSKIRRGRAYMDFSLTLSLRDVSIQGTYVSEPGRHRGEFSARAPLRFVPHEALEALCDELGDTRPIAWADLLSFLESMGFTVEHFSRGPVPGVIQEMHDRMAEWPSCPRCGSVDD